MLLKNRLCNYPHDLLFLKSIWLYLVDFFKDKGLMDHDSFHVYIRQNKKYFKMEKPLAHQDIPCALSCKTSAVLIFSQLLRIILMPSGTGISISWINNLIQTANSYLLVVKILRILVKQTSLHLLYPDYLFVHITDDVWWQLRQR